MEEWQRRVVKESNELASKISALRRFTNAPPEGVDTKPLKRQLTAMEIYATILAERIYEFSVTAGA